MDRVIQRVVNVTSDRRAKGLQENEKWLLRVVVQKSEMT
jgi:hypothetical protein